MKAATKKKIGIGALIAAVVATIVAVTRAKAAPPLPAEYALEGGEWETPMPFEVYSEHDFSMTFRNISDRRYDYDLRMELYPSGGYSRWTGSIAAGHGRGMSTNWYMPPIPGTYDMTLEITIDGVFMEEVVVSEVEVL